LTPPTRFAVASLATVIATVAGSQKSTRIDPSARIVPTDVGIGGAGVGHTVRPHSHACELQDCVSRSVDEHGVQSQVAGCVTERVRDRSPPPQDLLQADQLE
jgi:hypothetical protein